MILKRSKYTPFLLSLVFPGFGQAYQGKFLRGCIFLLLALLNPFLFGQLGGAHLYLGVYLLFGIELLIRFIAAIDAFSIQKGSQTELSESNRFIYLIFIGVWIGIVVLWSLKLPSIINIKTYFAATSSMEPTIPKGDYFVVAKKDYVKDLPKRGEIVSFPKPDGEHFMRVIGLPGDSLYIEGHIPTINGETAKHQILKRDSVKMEYRDTTLTQEQVKVQETLPNGRSYNIYRPEKSSFGQVADHGKVKVPDDSVWVMGDHRSYSRDSRYLGSIALSSIRGRVAYIYWGTGWGRSLSSKN